MCYELMCCLFLDCGNPEYSFGHCFLTLEWNLMSDIEGKALQKIDSCIMMEPDLVSTSAIGIVTAPSPPTAVEMRQQQFLLSQCNNCIQSLFQLWWNNKEVTKGIFVSVNRSLLHGCVLVMWRFVKKN